MTVLHHHVPAMQHAPTLMDPFNVHVTMDLAEMEQLAHYFNIFLPVQVVPFPLNPLLHVHWKDPSVLLHVASLEHGDEAHSFMSTIAKKKFFLSNFVLEITHKNIT